MIFIRSYSPETEKWLGRVYRPLILADAYVFGREHLTGVLSM